MSPKEKAKELYDKYFELVEAQTAEQQEDNARKAALISVDEIIKSNPHSNPFNTDVHSTMGYWNEVRYEIENL